MRVIGIVVVVVVVVAIRCCWTAGDALDGPGPHRGDQRSYHTVCPDVGWGSHSPNVHMSIGKHTDSMFLSTWESDVFRNNFH